MLSPLESISPTARTLLKHGPRIPPSAQLRADLRAEPHWFAIKSPANEFALLASHKRKPKLPKGHECRGPFKTRLDAVTKALLWEMECRPETSTEGNGGNGGEL